MNVFGIGERAENPPEGWVRVSAVLFDILTKELHAPVVYVNTQEVWPTQIVNVRNWYAPAEDVTAARTLFKLRASG